MSPFQWPHRGRSQVVPVEALFEWPFLSFLSGADHLGSVGGLWVVFGAVLRVFLCLRDAAGLGS